MVAGSLKIPLTLAPCILPLLGCLVGAETLPADSLPECDLWAERGDCDESSRRHEFMRTNCLMSCFKKERTPGKPVNRKVDLEGFYELRANTANGKSLRLENFDVYDTVLYSVARLCDGSTDAFYKSIKNAHALEPYAIEIVAFPFDHPEGDFEKCRQTNEAIEKRADKEYKIHIMEPVHINGPDTHPVFRYLKESFDIGELDPNNTYNFKINPDGNTIEMKNSPNFYGLMAYINPLGDKLFDREL